VTRIRTVETDPAFIFAKSNIESSFELPVTCDPNQTDTIEKHGNRADTSHEVLIQIQQFVLVDRSCSF
jgi:hypothetical protein